MKNKQIYSMWKQIKTRCFNKNNPGFKYYGGRGITMRTEWVNNFYSFQEYVMSLPNFNENNIGKNGITLDRQNNDENYDKGNLAWKTMEIQTRNRRKKSGNVTSKYIGVSYDNSLYRAKKWRARITISKKTIILGRFETELEAKEVRDNYIIKNKLEGFNIN